MGRCPNHCRAPPIRDRLAPGTRAFFTMLSGPIIPTSSAVPISEMCLFSCRGYNEDLVRALLHSAICVVPRRYDRKPLH